MKICMASYQAVSMLHGGPSTQLRMTARYLPGFGIEPVLFDPWKKDDWKQYDAFHLFAANIGTYHLAREIHDRGHRLVVSPIMFSSHSAGFVRNALKATRLLQKLGRGIWTDYALMADILAWAEVVLPNTRDEAGLVIGGLGTDPAKVTVIPNGVEERFAQADPEIFRKKYGISGFILNVGHIGPQRKNVLSLIRALSMLDHPSVIIGRMLNNSYAEQCRRVAGKHKQILLIDGIDHDSEMLASAYAACDVFALPSLFETPGIAALEAALAGAKIVITPHGGTKEYFADLARYVDPHSVESIKAGIEEALRSPGDGRLKDHVLKHFGWKSIAQRTAVAYQRFRT
jgi:glycosyltransferase involved in cell wall biosynthesis